MRTIGLCIADTHAGFKLGLMNPEVELYDTDEYGNLIPYTPAATAVQRYFWQLLLQGCEAVKLFARGDPIVVIHFGDATHGDRYPKALVTTELADQPIIAIANMKPIMALPNVRSFRLTAGTEAHNFDEANAEKIIMSNIKLLYPEIDCELVTHGLGNIDGFEIEYAHQGPFPGSRQHLKGNIAHQYLRDKMTTELLSGNTPPRIYGYGHYHEWIFVTETISVGNIDYVSSLMVMPSFNFPNLWTTAATRAQAHFMHGIVALEIIDGKLTDVKRFTKTIDRRTKEEL
jgi:hypothetical protein